MHTKMQTELQKYRNEHTGGEPVVLPSTNISFQRSHDGDNLTHSTTEELDDMSYDDLGGVEVSWAEDGCTFHVGHKVQTWINSSGYMTILRTMIHFVEFRIYNNTINF